MGAYLSEPVKEKHSEKGGNGKLKFGATSVQGWRISQEDAHNCILNFDDDSSLFAVYDGHGGSEVSEYTAKYLPDFLKSLDLWKNGDLVQALEHGFLSFDESLTKDTVLEELKQMAGVKTEEDGYENAENKQELLEEARLPLEEVLRRYGCYFVPADDDDFDHKKFKSPLLQAKKRSHQKKLTNGEAKTAENGSEAVEESSALNNMLDSRAHVLDQDEKREKSVLTFLRSFATYFSSSDTNDVTSAISSSEDPAKNVANVRSDAQNASPGSAKKHKMVASPDSTSAVDGEVGADTNGSNTDSACSPQLKRSRKDNSTAEAHPADTRDNEHCVDQSNSARNKVDSVTEANSTATVNTASSASADEGSNQQPTDAAAAALASDSEQRPSKVGVSKDAETVSSSNAVDSSSEVASEASKRSHCKSESQACDSTSTAFVSNPSSWPSRPNLHEIDQESSKKRLLDADPSPAPKRKAPAFDKDVSSDESESDDADFVCGLEESSDDADDTSDESASSDAENDAKPDSDEELEQAWHEGVDMIEDSEDDEFGEAPEEMFAVPSGDTPGVDSGTTACVALIKEKTLYVANAGDSRCVICRSGKAVDMSIDHKPEDEIERKRIENAGGQITADGRVNGGLNLSRAIGDHFYKKTETLPLREQMISSLPDVRTETLTHEDKFIVLACDGIWNSLSSQEVVDFVDEKLTSGVSLVEICEAMCDKCLAPSTAGDGTGCDNMTVIIVDLRSLFAENENTDSNHAEEKLACDSATD